MPAAYEEIHNHHEQAVFAAIDAIAPDYPQLGAPELLADVACVALNKLPPRYIRHQIDLVFYTTDRERLAMQKRVEQAVHDAFRFVQARVAMRARS